MFSLTQIIISSVYFNRLMKQTNNIKRRNENNWNLKFFLMLMDLLFC